MVHQHFMLVEAFTVAENIILGSETTKNGVLDIRKAIKDIKELSEKYGLAVDPTAKVEDISVGAQQRVEPAAQPEFLRVEEPGYHPYRSGEVLACPWWCGIVGVGGLLRPCCAGTVVGRYACAASTHSAFYP